MSKTIDLSRSVYELVTEYPELADIMADLGFAEVKKPAMLNSVGKLMTLPRGAKMKHIPMGTVVATLMEHGFTLSGDMPAQAAAGAPEAEAAPAAAPKPHPAPTVASKAQSAPTAAPKPHPTPVPVPKPHPAPVSPEEAAAAEARTQQLKEYLRRLGAGESLESVRADFAGKFQNVEASEIMKAEQDLMKEGTPLQDVQKLCDIHSALFHGATREEQIANAEAEVLASLRRARAQKASVAQQAAETQRPIPVPQPAAQNPAAAPQPAAQNPVIQNKNERAAALAAVPGHPLNTLKKENEVLAGLLAKANDCLDAHQDPGDLLGRIRELSVHYAKKGDLLYPLLKVNYNISGPSDVMWTVDDEIRKELGSLNAESNRDAAWEERLRAVLKRAEEMIYKENNILFPICAVNFSETEWMSIYRDSKDYADCLGVTKERWDEAEEQAPAAAFSGQEGEIVMPGGHMNVSQLTALLNTIPMEITFVDADNINRFFNEGAKIFKRPAMALDREVFSCHPPKIEPMVRAIIEDFRSGLRDSVPIWMEKNGRTVFVNYMAVRDKEHHYLGTLEVVQDMEFAKEHFA